MICLMKMHKQGRDAIKREPATPLRTAIAIAKISPAKQQIKNLLKLGLHAPLYKNPVSATVRSKLAYTTGFTANTVKACCAVAVIHVSSGEGTLPGWLQKPAEPTRRRVMSNWR